MTCYKLDSSEIVLTSVLMSELQDELDRWDRWGENSPLFVDAARRIANLDKEKVYRYTTSVALLMGLENVLSATMMETLADAAIDAALGITENAE